MSILLDALKKSQTQRHTGQATTLNGDTAPAVAAPEVAQQWLPLTLMALSAVAMAWIGWQQFRMPEGLDLQAAVAQAQNGELVTAEVASAPGSAEPGAQEEQRETPLAESEIVKPGLAPGAPRIRTPVESYSGEGGSLRNITVLPPQDDATAVAASASRAATGTSAAEAADPGAPAAASAEPRPRESRRAAAEPQASEVGGPISFWELPQGVRDNLPDLRITVLVFAEQPADRFVLIGGKRVRESETVQEGVVLEEIRREGAVFSFRSYRFLVKG